MAVAEAERNDNRSSRHGRASSSSQRSRERRGAPLACALGKQIKQFFFYKKITEIRFVLYSASRQAGRQTHRCAVQWSRAVALVYAGARARRWSRAKKQTRKRKPRGTGGGRRGGRRQAKEEHGGAHAHPASQPVTHTQRTQGKGKGVVLVSICCCGCPAPPNPSNTDAPLRRNESIHPTRVAVAPPLPDLPSSPCVPASRSRGGETEKERERERSLLPLPP